MQLVHDARAHLHQPVTMPQQLPQIAILRVRYPYFWETIFQQEPQQQLRVLAIGLLLAYPFGADLGGIADPQLELQFDQQTLEPARVSAGFHAHPHGHSALAEFAVELLGLFLVSQAGFAQFARIRVYVRNLLEARVIITTYNDHVRLLSPEPSWLALAPPTLLGPGADIVMESLHSNPFLGGWPGSMSNRQLTAVASELPVIYTTTKFSVAEVSRLLVTRCSYLSEVEAVRVGVL